MPRREFPVIYLGGASVAGGTETQTHARGRSMRVGVLTGGGDCPGLNAVIRAIVRTGVAEYGYAFTGLRDAWRGPLEGAPLPLRVQAVRCPLPPGCPIPCR